MKDYIHARLAKEERVILEQLKKATGMSESEIVRKGLALVAREVKGRSALDVAGTSVGRFAKGPRDLSTNNDHLDGFGE
jgi:hypothetical protein